MEDHLMQLVADELNARGFDARISAVHKSNMSTNALTVLTGESKVAPTIYPHMLREIAAPGATVSEIADEVIRFTQENLQNAPDLEKATDKEYVLENTYLSACRTDWNEEFLGEMPHREIDGTDLSVYPKLRLEGGSVRITYQFLDSLGISCDQVMEAAERNTGKDYTIANVADMVYEMSDYPPDMEVPEINMFVLSNDQRLNDTPAGNNAGFSDMCGRALRNFSSLAGGLCGDFQGSGCKQPHTLIFSAF